MQMDVGDGLGDALAGQPVKCGVRPRGAEQLGVSQQADPWSEKYVLLCHGVSYAG